MGKTTVDDSFKELVQEGLSRVEQEHALLVQTLVSVLREMGAKDAAELLERGDFTNREGRLKGAEVQALSLFFQLLNLTEEHVSNSVRNSREEQLGPTSEPGHWGNYLEKLKGMGYEEDVVREHLTGLSVEPVFTKHPTEAKRWAVLGLHREIVRILRMKEGSRTPFEEEHCHLLIRAVLERLWLTGEIFSRKPEVKDELENLIYYLKEVFPAVFNRLDERLRYAWRSCWPEARPLEDDELPRLIFGSWVGGDRDGHPMVTAEMTAYTLQYLRKHASQVARARLNELSRKLSFSLAHVDPPEEMLERMEHWKVEWDRNEAWRAYVQALSERLDLGSMELRKGLTDLRDWLLAGGARRTVETYVQPLIRLLDSFGLHLARLDVRQNSDYYGKALSQMMVAAGVEDAENFPQWSSRRKLEFLNAELASPRPLTHPSMDLPPEAREVRSTMAELVRYREAHGPNGLGTLIVSMTRCVEDLLTVYVLGKEVGLTRSMKGRMCCDLPVVPLFETYDDLEAAPGIVDAFLSHPCTRESLSPSRQGGGGMIIMLGYSDSNKDTGIIASQWALQKAQERLLEIGSKHGISITFFHGRGGTVGRGAGPTHRFLEALPPGSLDRGLRITEQGEVIGQKFNTPTTAAANLEWLIAGSLGGKLLSRKAKTPARMGDIMDALADSSRQAYRELLEMPGFIHFYREATPIDAIEQSRIGSRPSRRTGQATLEDLRAIPWVFSWNQARFYLPGWYGVGSALEALAGDSDELYEELCSNLQHTPFLRYVFYNAESSLASSDMGWMEAYAALVRDESVRHSVFGRIKKERELTERQLEMILKGRLPDRRPRFWKTLQAREAPLKLLHAQQIALLKEFRRREEADPSLIENLLLVVNAIASGLRTTG